MKLKKNTTEIPRRLQRQIDSMNSTHAKESAKELDKKTAVKKKKIFRKFLFYFIALVFGVSIFLSYYTFDKVFSIKRIEVHSESKTTPVIRGIELYYRDNLVFLSKKKLDADLAKKNPQLKSIVSEKKFPSTIILTVEISQPFAALEVSQGGYFQLSADGRILEKIKHKPTVPLIIYSQKLNYMFFSPGDLIEYSDLQAALYFLQKTEEIGMRVDTIDIAGRSMIRLNLKNRQILFTTEKDKNLQTYQMATIVKQFAITGHDFKVLDLRFDKPLISN